MKIIISVHKKAELSQLNNCIEYAKNAYKTAKIIVVSDGFDITSKLDTDEYVLTEPLHISKTHDFSWLQKRFEILDGPGLLIDYDTYILKPYRFTKHYDIYMPVLHQTLYTSNLMYISENGIQILNSMVEYFNKRPKGKTSIKYQDPILTNLIRNSGAKVKSLKENMYYYPKESGFNKRNVADKFFAHHNHDFEELL